MPKTHDIIAFQGELGANSHIACQEIFPGLEPLACPTFEDALGAVSGGDARLGMIPIENSLAGRVADIHHLLPESGLFIIGEHFLRVRHNLMALPGAKLEELVQVYSHAQALGQCRIHLRQMGLTAIPAADTAGAAHHVANSNDTRIGAIASQLAAEIYGLDILRADIEDAEHNTTRFVVLARERNDPPHGAGPTMTSFIFQVRNVPAALYKVMGGFATNGINMTKLESYQLGGTFNATQFFADIEGHPEDLPVRRAFEELSFFTKHMKVVGAYPASPARETLGAA